MRVVVGRVGRAQGLRGEVTVEVRTDSPDERFAAGKTLDLEPAPAGGPGQVRVSASRSVAGRLVLTLAGIADRDAAERLRGARLVAEVDVTDHTDDEFHDQALIGLQAHDTGGRAVGRIAEVRHLPAQDLLVVRGEDGADLLVPFVRALVPVVDIPGGRVVLDLPEGLRDLGGS